jgi:hypothetical protein
MLTWYFCMLTFSRRPKIRLFIMVLQHSFLRGLLTNHSQRTFNFHDFTFSMHIILCRNNILILSPGLRFMPSLIGLGIASPTEVPHLTRVPSNSTDIIRIHLDLLYKFKSIPPYRFKYRCRL